MQIRFVMAAVNGMLVQYQGLFQVMANFSCRYHNSGELAALWTDLIKKTSEVSLTILPKHFGLGIIFLLHFLKFLKLAAS